MDKLVNEGLFDLLPDFKSNFGKHIRSLVHVDGSDVTIPLLMKIDVHSKNFLPFADTESNSLSSIQCDDNQCL